MAGTATPTIGEMPEMRPSAEERAEIATAHIANSAEPYIVLGQMFNEAYRDGYAAALSSLSPLIEAARDVINDAVPGLRYIRRHYHDERIVNGDLYGVDYDRVEGKAKAVLDALSTFPAAASPWRPINKAPAEMRVLVCGPYLSARGAALLRVKGEWRWLDDSDEEISPAYYMLLDALPAPPPTESKP